MTSDLTVADAHTIATPTGSRDDLLHTLEAEIRSMWSERTEALALASASLVDHRSGTLLWSGTLPIEGYPIRAFLEERFGIPVIVENDANAAAVGEHRAGSGVGVDHMVLLTIGTGVGGGLIMNGNLYTGATGLAGEVGHYIVDSSGPRCVEGCPGWGHLDVIGSGSALDIAAREAAQRHPESELGRRATAGEQIDGRTAIVLARAGDRAAAASILKIGRRLGFGIVTLVNVLNPELIVVGGGASEAGELLLEPIRRVVKRQALAPARELVRVELASLGAKAGLVGAAALALDAARAA